MVTVLDVAAYILKKTDALAPTKLQKLCYYAQAWSLVWDEAPLFAENIKAWANGPVVPQLWHAYKDVSGKLGEPEALSADQRKTVDAVLGFYGDMTAQELSHLTHQEAPWKAARVGLQPTQRGNKAITHDSMRAYYESLGKPR